MSICRLCVRPKGGKEKRKGQRRCSILTRGYLSSGSSFRLCGGLDLLLDDALEGDGISSKLGDTFSKLLDGHLFLVEVEAEESLVIQVAALGDVKVRGTGGVELLRHSGVGVVELLKEVGLVKRKKVLY